MCTWEISGVFNGNEPMTSAMPVLCPYELTFEATQMWAGQFVELMYSDSHYATQHVNNHLISWISNLISLSNRWCRNCSPLKKVWNCVVRTFSSFLSFPLDSPLNPSCAVFPAFLFLLGLKDNSVKNQYFSFRVRKQNLARWDGDIWISGEGLIPWILLVYYCKAVLVQPKWQINQVIQSIIVLYQSFETPQTIDGRSYVLHVSRITVYETLTCGIPRFPLIAK